MIKNDRQYSITKASIRKFEDAISGLAREANEKKYSDQVAKLHRLALESQIEELTSELMEYEVLKEGKIRVIEAGSVTDLPIALIKARIASGMTHRDLADKLELREQQVQRWEASNYTGASLETLLSVATALGVHVRQEVFLPSPAMTGKKFVNYLVNAGLPRGFILDVLLPGNLSAKFREQVAGLPEIIQAATIVGRIFGGFVSDIVSMKYPSYCVGNISRPRFKKLPNANEELTSAYVFLCNYLAGTLIGCVHEKRKANVPNNFRDWYRMLTGNGVPMNLKKAVDFAWDCGILVVPIKGAGGFHGAIWRFKENYVIILKQQTELEARWLFDLLHEIGHIVEGHLNENCMYVEKSAISELGGGADEESASEWAEDVIFDGRSDEIEQACVKATRHKLQNLKQVVPAIATEFNVNVGALANHMSYRLKQEGENWWGAAHNLQVGTIDPFEVVRGSLLERTNLQCLNPLDQDLLHRVLG